MRRARGFIPPLGAVSLISANHDRYPEPVPSDGVPSATRCSMLGNLRISYKLLIIVGLSVLGIAAVAGLGLVGVVEQPDGGPQGQASGHRHGGAARRWSTTTKSGKQPGFRTMRPGSGASALLRTMRFGNDDYVLCQCLLGRFRVEPESKSTGQKPDRRGRFRRRLFRSSANRTRRQGRRIPDLTAFRARPAAIRCRNSPMPSISSRSVGSSVRVFISTTSMRFSGSRARAWP